MSAGQALADVLSDGRAAVLLVVVSLGGLVGVLTLWRYIRSEVVRGVEWRFGRNSPVTRALVGPYGTKDK